MSPTRGLLLLLLLGVALLDCQRGAAARSLTTPVGEPLHIVHFNDFHARFEMVSPSASTCKDRPRCVGGLPRLLSAIRAERGRDPEALVLNAGDNFQGTLWYSLFKWNATTHFLNRIPTDAVTIGNHEFDDGVAGVVPFLRGVKYPVLLANVDDSEEPTFQGLHQPSLVVEKGGRKIGIIGLIWKGTNTIARTERLEFTDELEALEREGARLKEQGVDVVVALTHCGYDVDLDLAAHSKYADVVVGAHSHTLLYNGTPPSGETPAGPYPTVVQQDSGRTVLVVQASAYTKYLGNLTVHLDADGEVTSWSGSPIYLDSSVPEDPELLEEMEPWRREVAAKGQEVLGETLVVLDKEMYNCYSGECSLGNFVTDSAVDHFAGQGPPGTWTAASIALTNAGGLRTNIEIGNVTYNDLVAAQPFSNTWDLVDLAGDHLLRLLEDSILMHGPLHWSGVHMVYDCSLPPGRRLVSARALCRECKIPVYEPIDYNKLYTLAAPSFVLDGGDNVLELTDNYQNRRPGPLDLDVQMSYLERRSPLTTQLDGRMVILNPELHLGQQRHRRDDHLIFA